MISCIILSFMPWEIFLASVAIKERERKRANRNNNRQLESPCARVNACPHPNSASNRGRPRRDSPSLYGGEKGRFLG